MNNSPSFFRAASQWLVAAFLAGTLGLFFLFATAFQVTSEDSAHRILRRGVTATTELDARLPQLLADLHIAADRSEGGLVRVPSFPVPVDIERGEARGVTAPDLRARILDQSVKRLYDDGMSVWAEADPEAGQDIERVSTAGGLHRAFGLATQKWNTIFLVSAVLFALLSLVLAALLWLTLRSYIRLLALGAAVSTASVISLAAAVAVRFALRTAETEADPFEEQLIDLGVDTVWLFVRNYLILSLLGFTVVIISSLFLWWQSRKSGPAPVRPLDTAF